MLKPFSQSQNEQLEASFFERYTIPSGSPLGTAYRTQDTTVLGHGIFPLTVSGPTILPLSPRVHLPVLSPPHFSLPFLVMGPEEIWVTRQLCSGLKQGLSPVGAHTIRLWQILQCESYYSFQSICLCKLMCRNDLLPQLSVVMLALEPSGG